MYFDVICHVVDRFFATMLIQYYGDLLRHNKIKSFALIYENPLASFPLIDQLVKNAGGTLFQRDQVRSEDVLSCNLLTVHSWAANYRNLLDTIPHRRECFYADGYSGFFQYHNFSFDDPKFHSLLFFGFIFNRDNHPLERVQKSFLQIPFSVLREAFLQLPRLKGLGSLACRFQENDAFLALRYWGRNDYTFRNEASFTDVLGDYIQTFVPKGKRLVIKGDTRIAPANLEQTVAMARAKGYEAMRFEEYLGLDPAAPGVSELTVESVIREPSPCVVHTFDSSAQLYLAWLGFKQFIHPDASFMTRNFQSELPVHRQRILANMTNNLAKAMTDLPHPDDGIIINNNSSITYLPREDVDFHLD